MIEEESYVPYFYGNNEADSNPICSCGSECMEGESAFIKGRYVCCNCLSEMDALSRPTLTPALPIALRGQVTLSLANQK
jgi:hypothetical protein